MNSKLQSPLEALELQLAASDEIISREQERNKYLRAKLDGMREMAEFSATHYNAFKAASTLSVFANTSLLAGQSTAAPKSQAVVVPKKRRQISKRWRPFLIAADVDGGATIQELENVAKGFQIEHRLMRTQLKYYLDTGLMTKNGDLFCITEAGREVSKIDHTEKSGTPFEEVEEEEVDELLR